MKCCNAHAPLVSFTVIRQIAMLPQDRALCSAPELFSDAAMRNALRKIAALQTKQVPHRSQWSRQQPPRPVMTSQHHFDASTSATGVEESWIGLPQKKAASPAALSMNEMAANPCVSVMDARHQWGVAEDQPAKSIVQNLE